MYIGCSLSAFKEPIEQALKKIKFLNFKYIDLIAIKGWEHIDIDKLLNSFDSYAKYIKNLLNENELIPLSINTAVGNLYDKENKGEILKKIESIAKLMNILNVKIASFYPGFKVDDNNWGEAFNEAVGTINRMYEIAEKYKVIFSIEFHYNTIFQTIPQCEKLISVMPDLKVTFDPSHFVMQGIDLKMTEKFFKHIVHLHMRDADIGQMQVECGKGCVDFKWIINTLKKYDYKGNASIEYLPDIKQKEKNIINLKKILEENIS